MSNFKRAREAKHISQKEIALSLGVSQPTVSEWESGKKNPAGKNLIALSELLGCSVDFILGRTNNPAPVENVNPQRNIFPLDRTRIEVFGRDGYNEVIYVTPEQLETFRRIVRALSQDEHDPSAAEKL